jgi:recombinational DNA repair ATPase RecF
LSFPHYFDSTTILLGARPLHKPERLEYQHFSNARTRPFDLLSEKVLAVAGIYGANASGKSNVIEALASAALDKTRSATCTGYKTFQSTKTSGIANY